VPSADLQHPGPCLPLDPFALFLRRRQLAPFELLAALAIVVRPAERVAGALPIGDRKIALLPADPAAAALVSGISRMNSGLRPSQTFLTMLS